MLVATLTPAHLADLGRQAPQLQAVLLNAIVCLGEWVYVAWLLFESQRVGMHASKVSQADASMDLGESWENH